MAEKNEKDLELDQLPDNINDESFKTEHVDSVVGEIAENNSVKTMNSTVAISQRDIIHPKFSASNVAMMATGNLPYYGEFNLFLNYHEAAIGTCGVNVNGKGMNFYWDRKFVDSLTQLEANFIQLHEDFHLIFDHTKRDVGFDHKLSNIAQDMIINYVIYTDIMRSNTLKNFCEIPKDHDEFVIDPQTTKSSDLKQAENAYLKITKQLCELAGDIVTEYKKLTDSEYTEKAALASIANPMVTIQLMMSLSYQFTQIKLKAMRDGGMNAEQTAWDNIAFHTEIEGQT
jgi:hypothetical protein